MQQAAIDLATEVSYETASSLLGRLSGIAVSSERLHTFTNQMAEGLSVLDVAPSRAEIDQRVAQVAAGRFHRPVLVLGIDGAYLPSRPEQARGCRPGQARYRARRARWRTAKYWGRSLGRQNRWVFQDQTRNATLRKFAWTKIVRHRQVPRRYSPDDPTLQDYWRQRRAKPQVTACRRRQLAQRVRP